MITATVRRCGDSGLVCDFRVSGDIDALHVPPRIMAERLDDLWRRTCFEAFVRVEGQVSYHEINVSPSGDWAAYAFSDYREGMINAAVDPPIVTLSQSPTMLELGFVISLDLPPDNAWQVGLSAVIEQASGNNSCWALRHAPGKADFHHDDGFALLLPG